ncbi:MAG: cation transporter [Clostridia bacterium]|nr:cation transporter [Clostridia bacterium]
MTDLLVRLFVKDSDNISNPKVRGRYGILSGCAGIVVNVILFLAKFLVGTVTNSIAITADAVNNLSDAGSCAVTVFGFKMSSKPADEDHPFGHGRIEYITAMVVSFIVLFMGFELLTQSIDKIRNPEYVTFNLVGAIIIAVSIFGKLWLALFNRKLGKKINSPAMTAVVADSLSDIAATSVTLIALVLSNFFPSLHIDGWLGIIVAGFVLKAGYGIFKETLNSLIGEPPTKETVEKLEAKILSYEHVTGIHDLILHNYGPDKFFGSVHVEMPSDFDVLYSHDIIDNIERDVMAEFGILLSIHYDPVEVNNARVNELKIIAESAVKRISEELSIHDFRVVDGPSHTNLIFDVVVPRKFSLSNDDLMAEISSEISKNGTNFFAVMNIEYAFV